MVTKINFLLTISIPCQEIRFWELMKWWLKRKWFDLLSNSLNFPFKKIYRDQVGELVCGFWGETRILSLISRLIFVISTLNFACKSLLPSSLNWEKMTAIGYSHFSLQEYLKGFFLLIQDGICLRSQALPQYHVPNQLLLWINTFA